VPDTAAARQAEAILSRLRRRDAGHAPGDGPRPSSGLTTAAAEIRLIYRATLHEVVRKHEWRAITHRRRSGENASSAGMARRASDLAPKEENR
jgi:hypothetical protein